MSNFKTREEWLHAFTDAARPIFKKAGYDVPNNVRLSVGFTSKGARSKRIGECWSDECSGDGAFEIFITPNMGDAARIADILTHELIHATVGLEAGHKKPFKDCMIAIGLTGKATATVAGPIWWEWAQPILDKLGALPHAELQGAASNNEKKQTTRMLKCACPSCGFVMRTSATWIDATGGNLRCPDPMCDSELGMNIG